MLSFFSIIADRSPIEGMNAVAFLKIQLAKGMNAWFNDHSYYDKERTNMTNFKKTIQFKAIALSVLLIAGLFILAGCGNSNNASSSSTSSQSETKTIVVAASPTPHAEILEQAVAPILEKEGYKLQVKEFTDYVLPNKATEEGEVDANFFQHVPYLDDFNAQNGTHLSAVANVHIEPMRIYAGKTASLDALQNGARIAVPNDATNEARALLLLQDAGLITLNSNAGISATVKDIIDNPQNLTFTEVEAATVPTVLQDVDIAVINTNYALGANIPASKILHTENGNSPYANVVVVKTDNKDSEKTKALVKAVNASSVAKYIDDTYSGAVIAVR